MMKSLSCLGIFHIEKLQKKNPHGFQCETGLYYPRKKNGSITANKNGMITCGCYDAGAVKDTTGAGDIFGGSAMWAVLQKRKTA